MKTLILSLLFALCFATSAVAGRLNDFEDAVSSAEDSKNQDDEANDISWFFELMRLIFANDDPDVEREYTPPPSTYHSPLKGNSLQGWEVQSRLAYGVWGSQLSGATLEGSFSHNQWLIQGQVTEDLEIIALDTTRLRNTHWRMGFQLGQKIPFFQALVGLSMLEGQRQQAMASTRLAVESRSRYHGFRASWDYDFDGKRKGMHDFYGGFLVKLKASQLDFGLRSRIAGDQVLWGPQLGFTFRVGEWE